MLRCGKSNRADFARLSASVWEKPEKSGFPRLRHGLGRIRARTSVARGRVRAVVDLSQYLPILIFLGIALALSGVIVFLPMGVARLTGAHRPNAEKLSEYECGFPAFEDPRSQFDVRFYLVAILFIIFDLEAAFLFPWAVSLDMTGWPGWITMMVFLGELAIGLAYAWKKGALDWE